MVKQWLFGFLLVPLFLFSGEFTASVNRTQVGTGDPLTLNLTLKDVSAQENPIVEPLKTAFIVGSQQQSFNTTFINGLHSSSITWRISLTPLQEGEITIPAISVNTSEGILSTEPIVIHVVKGASAAAANDELALTAETSNSKPYKNEPFFYTIKLVSKVDLSNVRIQNIAIDDAIIEANGEPKVEQKVIDWVRVNVITFSYHITPLKTGPLTIPSIAIQGSIPSKTNPFDDDMFQPMFMIGGFQYFKPFTLTTKEIVLDVQAAVPGMNPWLPAKALTLEETWDDSQTLQEGEPIVRVLKMSAEGLMSSQLPSISELQSNLESNDPSFKIYTDKPELGDRVNEGSVSSFRTEQHTLIPQKSGTLTLPEMSLTWWDVAKQEKAVARIPARTLQIVPRIDHKPMVVVPEGESATQKDGMLYVILVILGGSLLVMIGWVIVLQRKIALLKKGSKKERRKEKLPDLNPT